MCWSSAWPTFIPHVLNWSHPDVACCDQSAPGKKIYEKLPKPHNRSLHVAACMGMARRRGDWLKIETDIFQTCLTSLTLWILVDTQSHPHLSHLSSWSQALPPIRPVPSLQVARAPQCLSPHSIMQSLKTKTLNMVLSGNGWNGVYHPTAYFTMKNGD